MVDNQDALSASGIYIISVDGLTHIQDGVATQIVAPDTAIETAQPGDTDSVISFGHSVVDQAASAVDHFLKYLKVKKLMGLQNPKWLQPTGQSSRKAQRFLQLDSGATKGVGGVADLFESIHREGDHVLIDVNGHRSTVRCGSLQRIELCGARRIDDNKDVVASIKFEQQMFSENLPGPHLLSVLQLVEEYNFRVIFENPVKNMIRSGSRLEHDDMGIWVPLLLNQEGYHVKGEFTPTIWGDTVRKSKVGFTPWELTVNIVMAAHAKLGHLGAKQLHKYLTMNGSLVTRADVGRIIGNCPSCCFIKKRFRERSPLVDINAADLDTETNDPLNALVLPGKSISFDFVFILGLVFIFLIDRVSSLPTVEKLSRKSDVYQFLRGYVKREEKVHGHMVERAHSDDEVILHSKQLQRFFRKYAIRKSKSGPDDKSRNGHCEAEVGIFKRGVRCNLFDLPKGGHQRNEVLNIIAQNVVLQRSIHPREKFGWKCAIEMHYPQGHWLRESLPMIKKKLLPVGTEVVVPRVGKSENILGYFLGLDVDISGIGVVVRNSKTGYIIRGPQCVEIRRVPIGVRPTVPEYKYSGGGEETEQAAEAEDSGDEADISVDVETPEEADHLDDDAEFEDDEDEAH